MRNEYVAFVQVEFNSIHFRLILHYYNQHLAFLIASHFVQHKDMLVKSLINTYAAGG